MQKIGFFIICLVFLGAYLLNYDKLVIGGNELVNISFPGVVAIDTAHDGNNKVMLSVAVGKVSSAGGNEKEQGSEKSDEVMAIKSKGQTVFEANRQLTRYSQKDVNWGQNDYIIIGEEAARDNVLKYLEFFIRNHENRLTVDVVVAKGSTGEEITEAARFNKGDLAESLSNLFDDAGALSITRRIDLTEFINQLNSRYSAAIAPSLKLNDSVAKNADNEPHPLLEPSGMAVFKNARLIGFLDEIQSRGLNYITNNIMSTVIVVPDINGNLVSLEVLKAKAKLKTKVESDKVSIIIELSLASNIDGISASDDIIKKESLKDLENKQAEVVRQEIESVIAFAKENNADFLGFGDTVFHQHPVKWEKTKEKWEEIFPQTSVEIKIKSKIERSYNIFKPIRSWEES
ncbi:MAG: Spore germination protein B3 precursor [Firmicutes bacterium ADurb.Bin193]|nr:MAG: Spore germination protein B3 precursor [Firmicutes bacterium ADurb.Bin193]